MELIWKDRKRIWGMPISFTKYAMSDDRIFFETGVLNTKYEEIILYRVRDISLTRSISQKIFGVGTIVLHSSDKTTPHFELKNIKDPMLVKEMIHSQVEDMKVQRNMRFGEFVDDDVEACEMSTL